MAEKLITKGSTDKGSADTPRIAVEFLTSAPDLAGCPAQLGPEVAFAGRSNAGKSSVLNRLTGNRRTAKVSKTPGRTQLLNFFQVASGGLLVDLPGYGFAKAGRGAQQAWQSAVNGYLSHRDALAMVVLVMDIRHPLQPFDEELVQWSSASGLPLHILLNKADKLKHGARQKTLLEVRKRLSRHKNITVQTFSAESGLGAAELIGVISPVLQSAPSE